MSDTDAHEAAVEAIAGALCGPDRNQWRGAYGSIPPDPDAWHYETDWTCSYDTKKAAAIALAALVRSEAVRAALVDVGASALVVDWNRRPYVGQTAQEDAEAVVDAIIAALAP